MLKDFEIHVVRSGPQAVVRVCGDFDLASVPHWRDQVSSLLDHGVLDVTVEMAELDFIDSSGLNALVAALSTLRARGGQLTLRSPTPSAWRILEITGLTDLFGLVGTDEPSGARPAAEGARSD